MKLPSPFYFFKFYFKDFIYLLLERGQGREKERERNTSVGEMCGLVPSHTPPIPGPGPQPRHAPWLGIKVATFRFAGLCSVHWPTPARADFTFLSASSQTGRTLWKNILTLRKGDIRHRELLMYTTVPCHTGVLDRRFLHQWVLG